MVTKLDISLENIVKSAKTKLFTLITLTAMTLLPTGLFGNVKSKDFGFQTELTPFVEENHIQKGDEYFKQATSRISSEESLLLFNKALAEYSKALKKIQNPCDAWKGIGKIDLRLGFYKEAIPSLEKALKCKKDVENLLNISQAYRESGNFKMAEKYVYEALKIDDKSSDVCNSLGILNYRLGKYGDAEKNFKKAIELNNKDSSAMANLADTYSLQNKFEEAVKWINEAIKINPENATILFMKGKIYYRQGYVCEAAELIRKALELAPYGDNAREMLKKIESEKKCK